MRFYKDSDQTSTVRWFFVPRSRPWIGLPTVYFSWAWDNVNEPLVPYQTRGSVDLGEVFGAPRPFDKGVERPDGPKGEGHCGTPQMWMGDLSLQRDGTADVYADGTPKCCPRHVPTLREGGIVWDGGDVLPGGGIVWDGGNVLTAGGVVWEGVNLIIPPYAASGGIVWDGGDVLSSGGVVWDGGDVLSGPNGIVWDGYNGIYPVTVDGPVMFSNVDPDADPPGLVSFDVFSEVDPDNPIPGLATIQAFSEVADVP